MAISSVPTSPATPSALPSRGPQQQPRQGRQVDGRGGAEDLSVADGNRHGLAGPEQQLVADPGGDFQGRAGTAGKPFQGAAPSSSARYRTRHGHRRRCGPGRPGQSIPGPWSPSAGNVCRRLRDLDRHHRVGDVAHRLERHLADCRDHVAVHDGRVGVGRTHAGRLAAEPDPTAVPGSMNTEIEAKPSEKIRCWTGNGTPGTTCVRLATRRNPGGRRIGLQAATVRPGRRWRAGSAHPPEAGGVDRGLDLFRVDAARHVELREVDQFDRPAPPVRHDRAQRHRRLFVEPQPVTVALGVPRANVEDTYLATEQLVAVLASAVRKAHRAAGPASAAP